MQDDHEERGPSGSGPPLTPILPAARQLDEAGQGGLGGDLDARIAHAYQDAADLFEDPLLGMQWLLTPNQTLGMARPIDMLSSSDGAERVHTILARIRYGIAV